MLKRGLRRGLADFVDLDVAMEPLQLKYGMPTVFVEEHVYKPYVEAVRGAAGDVPVLSVLGRVTRMADAEAAIASGVCDMVGSTRELIAEPRFVKHAREGQEELGRTCIACNWCLGGMADRRLRLLDQSGELPRANSGAWTPWTGAEAVAGSWL